MRREEHARVRAAEKKETRQGLVLFSSPDNDFMKEKPKKANPPIEDKQTQESEDEGFFGKVGGWFKDVFSMCGSAQPHKNPGEK